MSRLQETSHTDQVARKCTVPLLNPVRLLQRPALLKYLNRSRNRVLAIEGQAGQGKTTLALQYLADLAGDHLWYRLESRDQDVVVLVAILLQALQTRFPSWVVAATENLLLADPGGVPDPERLALQFAADLEVMPSRALCLVFDDLHHLAIGSPGALFIGTLLSCSPRRLRYLLLTRTPAAAYLPANHRLTIGGLSNADLALNKVEIATLLNNSYRLALRPKTVRMLHRLSEGWITALILIGEAHEGGEDREVLPQLKALAAAESSSLSAYFGHELIERLPASISRSLMALAFLDEVPLGFLQQLDESQPLAEHLWHLCHQNFFVRQVGDKQATLVIHPLFRTFLKSRAEKENHADLGLQTCRRAGDWYLQQGDVETALDYYLRGGDFRRGRELGAQVGLALVASNRMASLEHLVDLVPEQILQQEPWFALFAGLVLLNRDPPAARSWLEQSLDRFITLQDAFGELLCLTQLIHFHIIIDGHYQLGEQHLPRAAELLISLETQLDVQAKTRITTILAYGYCFFRAEMERVDELTATALPIAEAGQMENLHANLHLVRAYRYGFLGQWPGMFTEVEHSWQLLAHPRVDRLNRLCIMETAVNLLQMVGDFTNYRRHAAVLQEQINCDMVARTVIGPFQVLWDTDLALAEGRLDEALHSCEAGLALPAAGLNPHFRSQYLHYQALIKACLDEPEAACRAAVDSEALRDQAGGTIFIMLNRMLLGAVYVRLRQPEQARRLLDQAERISNEVGEEWVRAAIWLQRADLALQADQEEQVRSCLRTGLQLLRQHSYRHLFAWQPLQMTRLLGIAVAGGIEADYARSLAAERLDISFTSQGEPLPLLKIATLGGLTLTLDKLPPIQAGELSNSQRQLLELLLVRPGLQRSLDELQDILWPGSPVAKAHSKLTSLISRTRTLLDQTWGPLVSRNYLEVRGGCLMLCHARVDAWEFQRLANTGLDLARQGQNWQAENQLHLAHLLWRGRCLPGETSHLEIDNLQRILEELFFESASVHARLLLASDDCHAAMQLLQRAVSLAPVHAALVQLLYETLTRLRRSARAQQVFDDYAKALRELGLEEAEITTELEAFWA